MQTSHDVLLTALENGVLTVTMNRPEALNPLDTKMLLAMIDALAAAEADANVRVVVITGAGRGFSSGADLREHQGPINLKDHLDHGLNQLVLKLRGLEKPVITAVNGIAAGAGASIALAGDIRLWSTNARFMQAFSKIGLIPDGGGTWLLPQLVGFNRAYELACTARVVGPEEGLRLGLCERLFPAEDFSAQVKSYAETLAQGPTRCYVLTKRAMHENVNASLKEALDTEGTLQNLAGASPDFAEGVAAFLEKREARFTGK
jgi:2-(1,2-epoxy-1,2-dihydrophenyl)acetyl-CoA isomerase